VLSAFLWLYDSVASRTMKSAFVAVGSRSVTVTLSIRDFLPVSLCHCATVSLCHCSHCVTVLHFRIMKSALNNNKYAKYAGPGGWNGAPPISQPLSSPHLSLTFWPHLVDLTFFLTFLS